MPKLKIGEKVVIGETQKTEQKRFTNGHKSFTSAETRAMLELQTRERLAAERFEQKKHELFRDRDPITGGVTPRTKINAKGEVIETTGNLLLPPPTMRQKTIEEEEEEIAQQLLLNQNPLKRADRVEERIGSLQSRQDNIGGELSFLKLQIEEKRKRLQQTHPNSLSLTATGAFKPSKF